LILTKKNKRDKRRKKRAAECGFYRSIPRSRAEKTRSLVAHGWPQGNTHSLGASDWKNPKIPQGGGGLRKNGHSEKRCQVVPLQGRGGEKRSSGNEPYKISGGRGKTVERKGRGRVAPQPPGEERRRRGCGRRSSYFNIRKGEEKRVASVREKPFSGGVAAKLHLRAREAGPLSEGQK